MDTSEIAAYRAKLRELTEMRGKSIIEVLLAFIIFYLIVWAYGSTEFADLELDVLRWSYVAGFLMFLIPVSILLLTRRDFDSYGLTRKRWKYNLDVGLTCYVVLLIPYGLMLAWILRTHISATEDMGGSVVSTFGYIIAIYLLLLILRRRESPKEPEGKTNRHSSHTLNLILLIVLLFFPIFMGLYLNQLTLKVVSTVIWQFIFSGFGEEILYRGYLQSRINQEFGRPYNVLGVNFGIGLIVGSLLFAFAHVLNPFNPFIGRFELAWWWGFSSFFVGLFLGLVREKTDSIVAAGIAHGLPDAVGEVFALLLNISL